MVQLPDFSMKLKGIKHPEISLDKEFEQEIPLNFSGCSNIDCRFTCTNSADLSIDLANEIKQSKCTAIDKLSIDRQHFNQNKLSENWISSDYAIHELSISSSDLRILDNEIFNTDSFTYTFVIVLQASNIDYLPAGLLLGLSRLEYLTISSKLTDINRVFFQPVRSSLRFLKISEMTEKIEFDEIFGISEMFNLQYLEASKNNFIKPITAKVFKSLPKLRYLKLSGSNIKSITEDAFNPISNTLKFLDISQNKLIHIYNLESLLKNRNLIIYVRENNWICDCNLLPLVTIYTKFKDNFMDVPYCRSPHNLYGTVINEIEYNCSSGISKSTIKPVVRPTVSSIGTEEVAKDYETTTKQELSTSATEIDIPPKKKFVKLTCLSSPYIPPVNFGTKDTNTNKSQSLSNLVEELKVHPPYYNSTIRLLSNNSIEVIIEESEEDISVIWYSDPDSFEVLHSQQFDVGCKIRRNHSIVIENLQNNVSYTICLIPKGDTEIPPFNCLPYHIPSNQNLTKDDPWISNDDKEFIIAMICLVFSISVGLGGAVSYFIIKSYPNLLEGSKHVLIVKKSEDNNKDFRNDSFDTGKSIKNFGSQKISSSVPFTVPIKDLDVDSAYETPVDFDLDDPCSLRSENSLQFFKEFPKLSESPVSPPPLPKRNSEHIYGRVGSPLVRIKRSI